MDRIAELLDVRSRTRETDHRVLRDPARKPSWFEVNAAFEPLTWEVDRVHGTRSRPIAMRAGADSYGYMPVRLYYDADGNRVTLKHADICGTDPFSRALAVLCDAFAPVYAARTALVALPDAPLYARAAPLWPAPGTPDGIAFLAAPVTYRPERNVFIVHDPIPAALRRSLFAQSPGEDPWIVTGSHEARAWGKAVWLTDVRRACRFMADRRGDRVTDVDYLPVVPPGAADRVAELDARERALAAAWRRVEPRGREIGRGAASLPVVT